jgi:hypothetical protein
MHNLLKRQLKKIFGESSLSGGVKGFIKLVDDAYREFDIDRNMLERSLEVSSPGIVRANSEMRAIFEALPDLFFRIDYDGKILDCKAGNTSDLYISAGKLLAKRFTAFLRLKFGKNLGKQSVP